MTAIAPITGMLKRKFARDLTASFVLGGIGGAYFWYGIHVPETQARLSYHAKLKAEKESQ
ncbi:hypothetical protein BKA69DRAFT_862711 [Paraphysoderma sedebokerense]|nr:hypothetical protein BKA69DRAFT_862711 [Paraphysoderma sedebokerense]